MSIAFVLKEPAIIPLNSECSVQIIIYPYKNQEVRDLAWSCFSPNLINIAHCNAASADTSLCQPELSLHRQQWLHALDRDPSRLQQYLQQKSTRRLGIYFERLWYFFLQEDPETELLAHNLPVQQSGRTLGEFDCLYFCRRRERFVHLELAVKFYLCDSESAPSRNWQAWIGPDCRDRMDLKLSQMLTRQIHLGDTLAGEQALNAKGIVKPIKEIALKGHLFRHPTDGEAPPPDYNPDKPISNWIRPKDLLAGFYSAAESRYRYLQRSEWLSPANTAAGSWDLNQLVGSLPDAFQRKQYPLLVAKLDADNQESDRFFVVPPSWPWES